MVPSFNGNLLKHLSSEVLLFESAVLEREGGEEQQKTPSGPGHRTFKFFVELVPPPSPF